MPISLESLIAKTLNSLPERSREVVSRRFGLEDGEDLPAGKAGETLQAIGDDHGLTRERVRQIEADALSRLRQPELLKELAVFSRPSASHIKSWGGLRKETTLYKELGNDLGFRGTPNEFRFLLTVAEPFSHHPENEHHHHIWSIEQNAAHNARKLLIALHRELNKIKSPQSWESLCDLATELCRRERLIKEEKMSRRFATSSLDAASFIASNPFGEYGLHTWERVQPKSTGERAFLILEKAAKPLHFREIAEAISKTWARPTHEETVHNELIKDPRFVLVGRGTYALAQWGYQPGTVSDVIVEIFDAAGKALSREEILERVLKQRFVKPSTVLLNLSNRKLFARTPEGKYTLKK